MKTNKLILLYLHSADGKPVASKSFKFVEGSNQFNWNLQSVPPGKYFISSGKGQFANHADHNQ